MGEFEICLDLIFTGGYVKQFIFKLIQSEANHENIHNNTLKQNFLINGK